MKRDFLGLSQGQHYVIMLELSLSLISNLISQDPLLSSSCLRHAARNCPHGIVPCTAEGQDRINDKP